MYIENLKPISGRDFKIDTYTQNNILFQKCVKSNSNFLFYQKTDFYVYSALKIIILGQIFFLSRPHIHIIYSI